MNGLTRFLLSLSTGTANPGVPFSAQATAGVEAANLPEVMRACVCVCVQRVTSTSGTACACVAGYEASGFATDGGVRCVACGVGQYSTAAVPAVSCVLCPVGTTTVGTNATSAAQCVCQPGAYADANGACALCPQVRAWCCVGGIHTASRCIAFTS